MMLYGFIRHRIFLVFLVSFVLFSFTIWLFSDLLEINTEKSEAYSHYFDLSDQMTQWEKEFIPVDHQENQAWDPEIITPIFEARDSLMKSVDVLMKSHHDLIGHFFNLKILWASIKIFVFFLFTALFILFLLTRNRCLMGKDTGHYDSFSSSIFDKNPNSPLIKMGYNELLHSIPMGIIVVNNEERVNFFNLHASSLLGDLQLDKPISNKDLLEGIKQANRGEATRALIRLGSGNGEGKSVELDAAPLPASGGAVLLLVDKTELLKLEARTFRAEKLSALARLTAGLSHEINNPITAISSISEGLLEDLDDKSPFYEDMQIIEENAHRCRIIIQKLLDFAKPHHSVAMGVDHNRCDIHGILDNILDMAQIGDRAKNIVIRRDYSEFLPLVATDCELLRQAFFNIIENSIDAMENGGILSIITSLAQDDKRGSMASIIFKDTGPGIGPEILEQIFEPFFTTKTHKVSSGVGMGLSIVSSIVDKIGGEILVESKPGEGFVLKMKIPIRERGVG